MLHPVEKWARPRVGTDGCSAGRSDGRDRVGHHRGCASGDDGLAEPEAGGDHSAVPRVLVVAAYGFVVPGGSGHDHERDGTVPVASSAFFDDGLGDLRGHPPCRRSGGGSSSARGRCGRRWSTSGRSATAAAQEGSAADEFDENESEEGESEDDQSRADKSERAEDHGDAAGESATEKEAVAEDVAADGASQDAGGSSEAGFGPAAAPERTAQPRPGRRKAAAGAGESAFNGVDTAAVRARGPRPTA